MMPLAESVYWSSLASSLVPYIPGEQPKDRKFIKLNTNENPYPPSPKVLDAIRNTANDTLRLYPEPSSAVLREAVAKRWNINAEQVFCGNGSDEILAFAFAAFFNSNVNDNAGRIEPILFPKISYSFYPVYAALWNIPYKTPELGADFTIDHTDYTGSDYSNASNQNSNNQKTGGVILPNPNAPTGRALSIAALKQIAEAQAKYNKVFIIDEAYIAFTNEPGAGSMIPFINDHPNLLVIRTLSKDASLAGLRAGYAVGSTELIEGLCRVRDSFNSYTMDRLAQAAAAAAISDIVYYDEINAMVIKTRERTEKALQSMGFNVIPSHANFVFAAPPVMAHNATETSAAKFSAALREKGILVRHFNKPEIENYLRISMGTGDEMDFFIAACKECLSAGALL